MECLKEIAKKIAKLIDVKSIISITTTFVFCKLALEKYLTPDVFISLFSIIIGFYFGIQKAQKEREE